jgi:ribosomal protein S18 acetylase RimI-like enzyme
MKSGTTWAQAIVAMLLSGDDAVDIVNDRPSVWLDHTIRPIEEVIADLDMQSTRRCIKTHTPLDGLPVDDNVGGVVYYDDMSKYGSGGTATQEKNASGIRLLCVNPKSRGMGVGKALTNECIRLAKASGNKQVILHTTQAMEIAWSLYLKIGFERSADLDFSQEGFPVFGFRLMLTDG